LINKEKKNGVLSPETLKSIFHVFAVYMADSFSQLIDDYRLGINFLLWGSLNRKILFSQKS